MNKAKLSIVVPALNEELNIPVFYLELKPIIDAIGIDWELIFIDDHSSDDTLEQIQILAEKDNHVRGFRLSRNYGSHIAIACGLDQSTGSCAVIMAADMQDPPKVIPQLISEWEKGSQLIWAVRTPEKPGSKNLINFPRMYYFFLKKIAGIKNISLSGADFLLLDRRVIDSLSLFNEKNVDIFALLNWIGFRHTYIQYRKDMRLHGKSGWSLQKKFKLVIDSILSFSNFPIKAISLLGILIAFLGFAYSGVVFINYTSGNAPQGWTSLMIVVLITAGIQMTMMGLLGEYLSRILDESRNRPKYVIENEI